MSTIRLSAKNALGVIVSAGERIDRITREQALDAVRMILDELTRIDRLVVDAMCVRAGLLEVALCHDLGFIGRLESIDFKALRNQIGAAHDHIHSAHYAALFPDLWAWHQARLAAAAEVPRVSP